MPRDGACAPDPSDFPPENPNPNPGPDPDPKPSSNPNPIPQPQGAPRGLLLFYALHRISLRPTHGYEILQDIESKTNGAWRPGAGSIYPMLKRLEVMGYIQAEKAKGEAVEQKVYAITPAGAKYLRDAKKACTAAGQRWNAMKEIFIELMDPEDLAKFFTDGMRAQSELMKEMLRSKMGRLPRSEIEYMMREYALVLERQLDWANRVLSEIRSKPEE